MALPMTTTDRSNNHLVISYLHLRKTIGWLGIAFPFVLITSSRVCPSISLRDSISAYYHTCMQDIFVCILGAIGVFLISYKGYRNSLDNFLTHLSGIAAIGVALFPVTETKNETDWIGHLHYTFASLFFVVLILLCFHVFTRTDGETQITAGSRFRKMLWKFTNLDRKVPIKKRWRNRIYRGCGFTMLICIAVIAVYMMACGDGRRPSSLVFWSEVVALEAFGIAWLVKGKAIRKL